MGLFGRRNTPDELKGEYGEAKREAPKGTKGLDSLCESIGAGRGVIVRGYEPDLAWKPDRQFMGVYEFEANMLHRHGYRPVHSAWVPMVANVFNRGNQVVTYMKDLA